MFNLRYMLHWPVYSRSALRHPVHQGSLLLIALISRGQTRLVMSKGYHHTVLGVLLEDYGRSITFCCPLTSLPSHSPPSLSPELNRRPSLFNTGVRVITLITLQETFEGPVSLHCHIRARW